jgi:hypothetical protein
MRLASNRQRTRRQRIDLGSCASIARGIYESHESQSYIRDSTGLEGFTRKDNRSFMALDTTKQAQKPVHSASSSNGMFWFVMTIILGIGFAIWHAGGMK